MGQLFAPRAFGSKKCVVRAFVVRPDTHSRFSFSSAEASRNLGFLRGTVPSPTLFLFYLSIATMPFAGYFLVRSLLSSFPAHLRTFFRFDFVWFRLSVQERILANLSRASRAGIHSRAESLDGIEAVACMCVRKK